MNSKENPDEVIEIVSKIIDSTKDEGIKYDACQFMAYAYKAKNDLESASKAIDLIPEIYFSNLRIKASILEGEEKWNAACKEYSESLYALMFITDRMAECYEERKEYNKALEEYEIALQILDILKVKENWYGFRERFRERAENIRLKID